MWPTLRHLWNVPAQTPDSRAHPISKHGMAGPLFCSDFVAGARQMPEASRIRYGFVKCAKKTRTLSKQVCTGAACFFVSIRWKSVAETLKRTESLKVFFRHSRASPGITVNEIADTFSSHQSHQAAPVDRSAMGTTRGRLSTNQRWARPVAIFSFNTLKAAKL